MRRLLQKIIVSPKIQTLLLVASVLVVGLGQTIRALDLTSRRIIISTSKPSVSAIHTFSFNIATLGTIGSIEFEYCTNTPFVGTACTAPAGLNVASANLVGESGETGFNVDGASTTANRLVINRIASPANPQTVIYSFDTISNPSTAKQTIYVRISTFLTTDASGARTDSGSVAFSTSGVLNVAGYVPPYLTFCVGITVAGDCSSIGSSNLNLGELSKSRPSTATSQYAGASNDFTGFSTSLAGSTMTSGSNIINPLTVPTTSAAGTSQFGLNMRANSSPAVGLEPSGPGTSNLAADFNIPNQFVMKNGVISSSPIPSDFRVFTVSYIVNVPPGQPAGIYSTTLTYIATASF